MRKITDYIWDACSVLGAVFLFIITASYVFPTIEAIETNKLYILVFFVCLVIGKYLLDKRKCKN